MVGFIRRVFEFIRQPTNSRTLGVLIFFVLVAAVSLTVYVAQQQQQLKQRAAENQYSCTRGFYRSFNLCNGPITDRQVFTSSTNQSHSCDDTATAVYCIPQGTLVACQPSECDVKTCPQNYLCSEQPGSPSRLCTCQLVGAIPSPQLMPDIRIKTINVIPNSVQFGQDATLNIVMENMGKGSGSRTIYVRLDKKIIYTIEKTLAGGASETIKLEIPKPALGSHFVDIDAGAGTSFDVISPSSALNPTPTSAPKTTTSVTPASVVSACLLKSQGDANCDGKIDIRDFSIWRDEFNGTSATKKSDFNNDGFFDIEDFSIWSDGFSK